MTSNTVYLSRILCRQVHGQQGEQMPAAESASEGCGQWVIGVYGRDIVEELEDEGSGQDQGPQVPGVS